VLLQAPISDYNLADVFDSEESTPSKRITTCRSDVRNWRAALQSTIFRCTLCIHLARLQTPVPEAVRTMKEAEVGAILVTEGMLIRQCPLSFGWANT